MKRRSNANEKCVEKSENTPLRSVKRKSNSVLAAIRNSCCFKSSSSSTPAPPVLQPVGSVNNIQNLPNSETSQDARQSGTYDERVIQDENSSQSTSSPRRRHDNRSYKKPRFCFSVPSPGPVFYIIVSCIGLVAVMIPVRLWYAVAALGNGCLWGLNKIKYFLVCFILCSVVCLIEPF
ncbi:hypothetical protein BZA70DRAFT_278698 [Myxozyma melibiosi]|uniref:Uncharacterized protein n=1 Tax=Myxozyma melibiosi TaxID=54550 RepID=A0ABR1F744_9ASCO